MHICTIVLGWFYFLFHFRYFFSKPTFNKKEKTCNCRAEPCPLNKNCLASNLIYKATIKTDNTTKICIGSTSTTVKDRYRNHKASLNNKQKRYSITDNYRSIYGN